MNVYFFTACPLSKSNVGAANVFRILLTHYQAPRFTLARSEWMERKKRRRVSTPHSRGPLPSSFRSATDCHWQRGVFCRDLQENGQYVLGRKDSTAREPEGGGRAVFERRVERPSSRASARRQLLTFHFDIYSVTSSGHIPSPYAVYCN